MADPSRSCSLTYAEYLELERSTNLRHEYLDGEAWAMAGGTPRHSAIKLNLYGLAWSALGGRPCRAFDSDLKIRVSATGLATYLDMSIVCGELEADPEDRNAVTNPVVLVEVLSDTTEAWDRGGKFGHYRQLPALQHYLLIDQSTHRIEHFERQASGSWLLTEYRGGQVLKLDEIGLEIPVDALYRDLPREDP